MGLQHEYRALAERLVSELRCFFGDRLVSVVFFGSVARGGASPDSDLDLLVVAEGLPRSRFRRQDLFMQAESRLQPLIEELWARGLAADFSPILLTPEEARGLRPLYLDMVYDAVIAYDRDGFFASVLDRLRRRLAELKARRLRAGRLWYWDLKPGMKLGETLRIE